MSKKLRLNFFWHMHQPYYADDGSGIIEMPWVYLHALKDYYEMLWLIERHANIKATFNLSPGMLIQLERYVSIDVKDKLLMLFRMPVASLNTEERLLVERYVRNAHYEHQIKPLARYAALHEKLENSYVNDAELCELETLFLLSWCGNALREQNVIVQELLFKAEGYDEHDKHKLLHTLAEFIGTIIPEYGRLCKEGRIALAINPMFHPIMPLLMDINSATESKPGTKMPNVSCSFAEDAKKHLDMGIETFTSMFGFKPQGIWPSEGSVNDESLQLYEDVGLGFAASDEEILFASLNTSHRDALYRPYHFKKDGGLTLVFRDKTLSDRIGFHYAAMEPQHAADDFMGALRHIYDSHDNDVLVSVILDGENAWEYYPDNALHFFDALYNTIAHSRWCECVTLHEVASTPQKGSAVLDHVHPGSWICRDFSTWIGQDEKNRAWEMLCHTRNDFENCHAHLSDAEREAIEREFMVAQGSDWFWWYGEGHHTDYADLFDTLFRKHLINIYSYLKKPPPIFLLQPIHAVRTSERRSSVPTAKISPLLGGENEHFFEWLGAGVIESDMITNVMDTSEKGIIKRLRYGFDEHCIYMALDGAWEEVDAEGLCVELEGDMFDTVTIAIEHPSVIDRRKQNPCRIQGVINKIIEISVPIEHLVKEGQETFTLQVVLKSSGGEMERFPVMNKAHMALYLDSDKEWFV